MLDACGEVSHEREIPSPSSARSACRNRFLTEYQEEARPFAIPEALAAIRRIFPDLDISDADLVDAITSKRLMQASILILTLRHPPRRSSKGRLSAGTTRAERWVARKQRRSDQKRTTRAARGGEPRRPKTEPIGLAAQGRRECTGQIWQFMERHAEIDAA